MRPTGLCGYSQYVVSVTVTINVLPDKANKKRLSFIEIVTFHCFQRHHKKPPRYAFPILNVKKNPIGRMFGVTEAVEIRKHIRCLGTGLRRLRHF